MNEELATIPDASPLAFIQSAVDSGATPDTLRELLTLKREHEADEAKKAFNQALFQFQAEMPKVGELSKGHHSNYASFEDIMGAAQPYLEKHGLALSFDQYEDGDNLKITCTILHRDGHSIDKSFSLPKDGALQGGGNKAQERGSANTYGRRYCLVNALNIVTGDKDDDSASLTEKPEPITGEQELELIDLLEASGVDQAKFLAHFKIATLADMPMSKFGKAASTLAARIKRNGEGQG